MNPCTGTVRHAPELAAAMDMMGKKRAKAAFTCTDLIAVLGVLAVLAALFVSGRARAAVGAPASVCLENMRRLSLAWYLYASDHDGRLVNNFTIGETRKSPGRGCRRIT